MSCRVLTTWLGTRIIHKSSSGLLINSCENCIISVSVSPCPLSEDREIWWLLGHAIESCSISTSTRSVSYPFIHDLKQSPACFNPTFHFLSRRGCVPGSINQWGQRQPGSVQASTHLHNLHGHAVPYLHGVPARHGPSWTSSQTHGAHQQGGSHGHANHPGEGRSYQINSLTSWWDTAVILNFGECIFQTYALVSYHFCFVCSAKINVLLLII